MAPIAWNKRRQRGIAMGSSKQLLAIILIASGVLATAACGVGIWNELRVHVHREVPSPNGRSIAIITKRQKAPLDVVVIGVTVVDAGGNRLSREIDERDLWFDVTEQSYPVQWMSDADLAIGDQHGAFEGGWHVSVAGGELRVR
jgi:hypothetical protein